VVFLTVKGLWSFSDPPFLGFFSQLVDGWLI